MKCTQVVRPIPEIPTVLLASGAVMRYTAIAIAIASLVGCRSAASTRICADSQSEMLTAVRTVVPIGTSIDDARLRMERAGFDCELVQDGSFSEDPGFIGDDRDYRSVANVNYLDCQRNENAGFLVTRLWSVAILCDDTNAVSDVLALQVMTGP